MRPLSLALSVCFVFLLGCDTAALSPEPQVVVEAYLQADAPVPPVRLTRTTSVDAAYTPETAAVEGAEVVLQRLRAGGGVAQTVDYAASDSTPGLYTPASAAPVVPQATYRLRATTLQDETITATTTVPGRTTTVRTQNDTTTYPGADAPAPPQFTLTIAPGPTTANRQNVYVLTSRSLLDFQALSPDTLQRLLTPFYQDGFDAEDDTLASLRVNSSGLLNEANFTQNTDSTVTIRLPWLAVAFYGPNRIRASVVDDNYYDFLRTQTAQQQSLAPGAIPNVIEHVEGGTGIFGSYARAGATAVILPPDGAFSPGE